MFTRKQDVDKHVSSILSRKRDEKERNAQGFQISRLYADIQEYALAKRYLSGFLHLRENVPHAHELMGDINVKLGLKENAVDNFKRALDLSGFGSSSKQLVRKICELYCELGTDPDRMKYWIEKCEQFFPRSEIVFKLKSQLANVSNGNASEQDLEQLLVTELNNRPTDLDVRLQLIKMYLKDHRYEEAYSTALKTDLTTAFVEQLPWFKCLLEVFQKYLEHFEASGTESEFTIHFLHVLRNLAYLQLVNAEVSDCATTLQSFDERVKIACLLSSQDEAYTSLLREMKGQLYFLAGLLLLKRAQTGAISWKDVSPFCGACFLASSTVLPLDCQAPWFVAAAQDHTKFYTWWYHQSYCRLSQVGHGLQQLASGDLLRWSTMVKERAMTASGQKQMYASLFPSRPSPNPAESSFLFSTQDLVVQELPEPLSARQLVDIDRVSHQVHLGRLSHLVWFCLQRYSKDMDAQPNYFFSLMENLQFTVKNFDSGAAESMCQLDILVFLLATVRCAASSMASLALMEDNPNRLSMLPICLSKPLCTPDQEQWWTAAYKFCTNSVKEDFSRLRRILIRGLEVVRLIGAHGMSVLMIAHIARSLDAKVKSLKDAEYGCRCPAYELTALESRAAFYWERTRQVLIKLQRNQHSPLPKNRLFKESGDQDVTPRMIEELIREANYALALRAISRAQYEEALEGLSLIKTPWAIFQRANIYKQLAEREARGDKDDAALKMSALLRKAKDCLYEVMDHISTNRNHDLASTLNEELENVEARLQELELDPRNASSCSSFHTPSKSPSNEVRDAAGASSTNLFMHSTPRPATAAASSSPPNGHDQFESSRPRPSPERLDSQIRSLGSNQASLFKMVLDRNEELILINGKMMEELRDNNNQLKAVLSENRSLMEELKVFLRDNKDMMKQMKSELANLKPNLMSPAPPQPAPPPLFMPPLTTPRGPYPGFPPQQSMPLSYRNYFPNSPIPGAHGALVANAPSAAPQFRGMPGSRLSSVGKYRPAGMGDEDDDEEEDDADNVEDMAGIYGDMYDNDVSLSQYYTPDSQLMQDWALLSRTGVDNQSGLPPLNQPRMNIPQSGYFSQALKGTPLQYTPQPPLTKPAVPGPGFFSTPVTTSLASMATPASSLAQAQGSIPQTVPKFLVVTKAKPVTSPGQPGDSQGQGDSVTKVSDSKAAGQAGQVGSSTGTTTSAAVGTASGVSNFGGFTFSGTPSIGSSGQSDITREKLVAHKSPTDAPKSGGPKPFAGFSLTAPSSTPEKSVFNFDSQSTPEQQKPAGWKCSPGGLFKQSAGPASPVKSPGAGDEVEEYEPTVDFKPVISLPDLVDKCTGEEDESKLFMERCRLFRFDDGQWKERGTGELKILSNNKSLKFRVVMRRDQILKLCANHMITADMSLTMMASSDRAWFYSAMDFSEEEMNMEQLAVKFKTTEKALAFQQVFEDCVAKLKAAAQKGGPASPAAGSTAVSQVVQSSPAKQSPQDLPGATRAPSADSTTTTSTPSTGQKSLQEMFKPQAGSWECEGCLVRNNADVVKCPACSTMKPGVKAPPNATSSSSSGFNFAFKSSTGPAPTGFGSPQASSASASTTAGPAPTGFGFGSPQASATSTGGPAPTGFSFGKPQASSSTSTTAGPAPTGFSFGKPQVSSTAPATASTTAGPAPTGFSFGKPQAASASSSSTSATTAGPTSTGFSFTKPQASFTTLSTSAVSSTETTTTTTTTTTTAAATPAGFVFKTTTGAGGVQAFMFGSGASPASSAAPPVKNDSATGSNSKVNDLTPGKFTFVTSAKETSSQESIMPRPPSEGLLAKLLTADEPSSTTTDAFSFKLTGGFSFSTKPAKTGPLFGSPAVTATSTGAVSSTTVTTASSNMSSGSSTGFQFSLARSPKGQPAKVPSSPEVDEHGLYVTREGDDSHIYFEPVVALPDKVEVKTGEEDETVLFESRGKMYRFVGGEWKEKGVGVVKILEHKTTKKTRVLMRRDQVLKICCNHKVDASISLQPMANTDGKAWVWYALDFSEDEGKMEQLALKFRNAETASEFKQVFDKCRDSATGDGSVQAGKGSEATSSKQLFAADSSGAAASADEDDDIIFVKEEKPTEAQIAMAHRYLLPDTFYLYETKPPCPGCIGCEDWDSKKTSTAQAATPASTKPESIKPSPAAPSTSGFVFGSKSMPDFASLVGPPSQPSEVKGSGFIFGSKNSLDFSSLADASGQSGTFAFAKGTESGAPFRFAGAGTKLFGASPARDEGQGHEEDGEDSGVAPSHEVHFEPVIPLPDLVVVKTGDEDWVPEFVQRAKLYKFDKELSMWKERGVGELKILKHKASNKFRILQRRDQVLKVSCNHMLSVDMELKAMSTSETAWCWVANDFTETEPSVEQFAAKFKTKEIATEFKRVFEKCQGQLTVAEAAAAADTVSGKTLTDTQHQQEEEEEEGEDEDEVLFEKRATLHCLEGGVWQKLGMGDLVIAYNEDLNGNSVEFTGDNNKSLCQHVICRELSVTLDKSNHSCEWQPIDFSTDEPIRRHFCAVFSSAQAAEDFAQIFMQGQRLAVESELSENLAREIDVPEVFSGGEPRT